MKSLWLPPSGTDFRVTYRGSAKVLSKTQDKLKGRNLWFGYGFSELAYDLPKSTVISMWGIRHSLQRAADEGIERRFLIIIPDALERVNKRAEGPEHYEFIPLSEPLADAKKERELISLAEARRDRLVETLDLLGYPKGLYDIRLASEISRPAKGAQNEGAGIGLKEIEQMLFDLKNSRGVSYHQQYEGLFSGEDEDIRFVEPGSGSSSFREDVLSIPINIQNRHITARLKDLFRNPKYQMDFLNWKAEYAIKQAALTIYLCFCYTPEYHIKIGPEMEGRFDKLVYSLLISNKYGPENLIPTFFKDNVFGSVLVEPELPRPMDLGL